MNITHLECALCGLRHEAGIIQNLCTACGKPLLVRYDLEKAAATLTPESMAGRETSLWRYAEVLPLVDAANRVSFGEGWTPLLEQTWNGQPVRMKLEYLAPSGSFTTMAPSRMVTQP